MKIRRASFVIAALVLATPCAALAEPAKEAGVEAARTLGEEGLRRFQAARWQEALDLFRRADAAAHAPTLVLYMAHCHARIGDLATAYRLYREVTREHLAADAPLQFRTAQGIAAQELHWLSQRLASVKVSVTGAPEGKARILVDGVEVPAADLEDLAVEPGDHVIEGSLPGAPPVRRTFTAVADHPAAVALAFDTAAPLAHPAPPLPPPRAPSLLLPAGITLGASGAALLVGTITGAISRRMASDIESRCLPGGHCLAADQESAASAGRLADASTGLFVVGSLAAASGIALAVLHARGQREVHVEVGPGRAVVGGAF